MFGSPPIHQSVADIMTLPDRSVALCGDCIWRYKYKKDFCVICYKLYPEGDVPVEAVESAELPIVAPMETEISLAVSDVITADGKVDANSMVQCNECMRWVHSLCEGIDQAQYECMTNGTHPVWGDEYLCPICRIKISSELITTLEKKDTLGLFAEPVTEEVAKNYYDFIRTPIDLLTMAKKASGGVYKSVQSLRQDFELMCLNAVVYNSPGDVFWVAAKDYFTTGAKLFKSLDRTTHSTSFGVELLSLVSNHQATLNAQLRKQDEARRLARSETRKKNKAENIVEYHRKFTKASTSRYTSSDDGNSSVGVDNAYCTVVSGVAGDRTYKTSRRYGGGDGLTVGGASSSSNDSAAMDTEDGTAASPDDLSLSVTLPKYLCTEPNLVKSSFPCAAVVLSGEDAMFQCSVDACLFCGSSGSPASMIFCVDCGECFHSYCLSVPVSNLSIDNLLYWRCTNCKICEVCGFASHAEEGSLLYCDGCDKAYHMYCLTPKLRAIQAESKWYCGECVECSSSVCVSTSKALALGSDHVTATKSWGFKRDTCYDCQEANVLKQRSLVLAQHPPNQFQKPTTLQSCGACSATIGALEGCICCSRCNVNKIHTKCYSIDVPISLTDMFNQFVCSSCEASAPSESNTVTDLLRKLRQVQLNRLVAMEVGEAKKVYDLRCAMRRPWLQKDVLLVSLLRWGFVRCQTIEGLTSVKVNNRVGGIGEKQWVRRRAYRFLSLWKRRKAWNCSGDPNLPKFHEQKQQNISRMVLGQDRDGNFYDLETLARLASLAAAYISCTSSELHEGNLVDLSSMVKILLDDKNGADTCTDVVEQPREVSTDKHVTECTETTDQSRVDGKEENVDSVLLVGSAEMGCVGQAVDISSDMEIAANMHESTSSDSMQIEEAVAAPSNAVTVDTAQNSEDASMVGVATAVPATSREDVQDRSTTEEDSAEGDNMTKKMAARIAVAGMLVVSVRLLCKLSYLHFSLLFIVGNVGISFNCPYLFPH